MNDQKSQYTVFKAERHYINEVQLNKASSLLFPAPDHDIIFPIAVSNVLTSSPQTGQTIAETAGDDGIFINGKNWPASRTVSSPSNV